MSLTKDTGPSARGEGEAKIPMATAMPAAIVEKRARSATTDSFSPLHRPGDGTPNRSVLHRQNVDETVPGTKPWTPAVTVFGQPDLRGVWLNSGATPLEPSRGESRLCFC